VKKRVIPIQRDRADYQVIFADGQVESVSWVGWVRRPRRTTTGWRPGKTGGIGGWHVTSGKPLSVQLQVIVDKALTSLSEQEKRHASTGRVSDEPC
jgi:hypothetical protein